MKLPSIPVVKIIRIQITAFSSTSRDKSTQCKYSLGIIKLKHPPFFLSSFLLSGIGRLIPHRKKLSKEKAAVRHRRKEMILYFTFPWHFYLLYIGILNAGFSACFPFLSLWSLKPLYLYFSLQCLMYLASMKRFL